MIRALSIVAALLLAAPVFAAVPVATPDNSLVEPALQQCILSATVQSEDSEGGPLITDCVSVGSAACQNAQSSHVSAVVVRCDGEELAFWQALMTFETAQLQKSLKPAGLSALRSSQKAWLAWKDARCDFAGKSQNDPGLVATDVSFCQMETTALRAIDLMAAL